MNDPVLAIRPGSTELPLALGRATAGGRGRRDPDWERALINPAAGFGSLRAAIAVGA